MIKLCFRIWALANLLVFTVFVLLFLPHGLRDCALALLYSSAFSLPAVPLLYFLLKFLRLVKGAVLFSWIVLLIGTSVIALLSYWLFRSGIHNLPDDLDFVLPLSFVTGYSSVLFFSPALHYLFQTFQYENN